MIGGKNKGKRKSLNPLFCLVEIEKELKYDGPTIAGWEILFGIEDNNR